MSSCESNSVPLNTLHRLSLLLHRLPQRKKGGGLSINSMVKLTRIDEKMVQMILHDYSICF